MMVLAGAAFAASLVSMPASASAPAQGILEASDGVSIAAYSDCPAARMCIWNNLNGGRPWGYFAVGDANLGAAPGPSGLNNNTESAWNRTSQYWCFYDGANYTSLLGHIAPGSQGNLLPEFRNRITSLRVCP